MCPKTNQPQAQNTRYSKKIQSRTEKKHTHWSQLRRAWGRHVPPFTNGWAQGGNASSVWSKCWRGWKGLGDCVLSQCDIMLSCEMNKNSKQETDQTVLTVTKALTKTTDCTCIAKKWRGTINNFYGASRRTCAPPHFQIHSGTTEHTPGLQKFGLGRHKTLVYTAA